MLDYKKKILPLDTLVDAIRTLKQKGRIVGFTNGCFDIMHKGHVDYLSLAKKEVDILIVGVNSDESITRLKGKTRPITSIDNRKSVLASLECVDFVVVFEQDTPLQLIKEIKPQVLMKGADYLEKEVVGGNEVKEHGGYVKLIPLTEGYSTSDIVNKIQSQTSLRDN